MNKEQQQKLIELHRIYEYCLARLPRLDGLTLTVEEYGVKHNGEFTPLDGIALTVHRGKTLICKSIGTDVDDALLDIYKMLLICYKDYMGSFDFRNVNVRPALDKQHLQYLS